LTPQTKATSGGKTHVPLPSIAPVLNLSTQQSPETSEQFHSQRLRAQQLSLKHSTSSVQWHLVPAAPEACQFLRMHKSAFPKSDDTAERKQNSNPNACCCIGLIPRHRLASSPEAAWLDLRKEDADVVPELIVEEVQAVFLRSDIHPVFSQCAPQRRRMYEPHDLPHILPSVKGPEEVHGSLLNSAYLNGPAKFRMLGRRKTRETGITLP
jgi:hypothetical protein